MPRKSKKQAALLSPCERCPLYSVKNEKFVYTEHPGWGGASQVLFIEETPADREWLKVQLNSGEYSVSTITRAVKCWDGKGKLSAKAIHCCREAYLVDELKIFKGQKIVALGNLAYRVLTGATAKMQELIGMPFRVPESPATALATWQPAMVEQVHHTQWLEDIVRTINWAFGKFLK